MDDICYPNVLSKFTTLKLHNYLSDMIMWYMPHDINIHYAPKNSYSYYLLYKQLSPARNSLFHAELIFIAANDFWVGITLQLLAHLTEGCKHRLRGALLLSHSTTDFQLFLALLLISPLLIPF